MDIRLHLKLLLNQIKADVIDRLIVVTGYSKPDKFGWYYHS